ncbi:Regulator of V-ATPase in vacuolar membrane protein 1 [Erysiphe neolycopersici]|uniref:Regulator of V-ATPase in vacuolar membrane protein 1 n=1 Tax=Erysiphe neolycopersici TaxID=212602 RepID=A0A420HUQ0_9PEZI|nr:Regulator of V-ATPase in vacuolar membrane protein 1 [Erysiphe neolycopersici]
MRGVLPGNPVPVTQALCTGLWDGKRFIAYITGNAVVILTTPHNLLQAIYDDSEEQLEAIAFDEITGKIAVYASHQIRIYRPYGQFSNNEDNLKWSLQESFCHDEISTITYSAKTLSWGSSEELLVGGSCLELFSTADVPIRIWKKKLANYVRFADLSYDSAFIASSGPYDRFVKIWRRQSFESDETRFDFSYLSHPAAVTNIYWRKPYHVDQSLINVLYTTCADQVIRIWVASDVHSHCIKHLNLWNQIDLIESLKPRVPSESSNIRFSFIIDSRDFILATEQAVQSKVINNDSENHALSHLVEVANHSPEICIVLDNLGHMSAWGMENISCKTIMKTKIFNIAHVNDLFLGLPSKYEAQSSQIQFYNYSNRSGNGLHILIHYFDGRIKVFESNLASLFDPSPRFDRFVSKKVLTGHFSRITNMLRESSGHAFVSWTDCKEVILWKYVDTLDCGSINRQSLIIQDEKIHKICVLKKGEMIMIASGKKVSLWDMRNSEAKLLAKSTYLLDGELCCMLELPLNDKVGVIYVSVISSKMKGIVWEIKPLACKSTLTNTEYDYQIREFCSFNIDSRDGPSIFHPLDTSDAYPATLDCPKNPNSNIAISHNKSGVIRSWSVSLNYNFNRMDWIETNSIFTCVIEPALVSGGPLQKVAIVHSNRTQLIIWNLKDAYIEHVQDYDSYETIQGLDWILTPDSKLLLTVQFSFRITTLTQVRYDFLNRGPSWITIRNFNIRDLTPHPIGDSMWLYSGDYIIGTGNQIIIVNNKVDITDLAIDLEISPPTSEWHIFDIVTKLNRPIPVYHPQFLTQCMYTDKFTFVEQVILDLCKVLKYYIEGDSIDNYLGINLEDFYTESIIKSTTATKGGKSNFEVLSDNFNEKVAVTETHVSYINDKLAKLSLPLLSRLEQINLTKFLKCFSNVMDNRRLLDENATKYQFSFLLQDIRFGVEKSLMGWREFNWAYQSNSQDMLIDIVSHQNHRKLLWKKAQESGICIWIKDRMKLLSCFEDIARNEYNKTTMRNPIDCSLFYLALRKKSVLQSLWRIATWNREQAATMKLLANNFQEKKWRTAAMKNAYVLLGKHRYEYAAAFFLLADCLGDSINVILTHLKDLQLAIAVARVYEGDESPALVELLEKKVLPLASQNEDRWMASWAYHMLHNNNSCLRVLISPFYSLSDLSWKSNIQTNSFLINDPALTAFYLQLRDKADISQEITKMEWNLVLQNVRLYCRMGCPLLALHIVRNWRFHRPNLLALSNVESYRLRSSFQSGSLIVTDAPSRSLSLGLNACSHQPSSNIFQEPDSTSLLDNFGF